MLGETFGNYRLVQRLGSGAMGTVFLGEHERIARRAAIKVLAPQFAEDPDILRRFFDEGRATSLIRHPAIVDVLDCGVHPDGQRPYIVMEHLEGETLAARLERTGPLAWPEACAVGRQIAGGLNAAHHRRIIHRDVKPANIMWLHHLERAEPAPAVPTIKLLDFGVAKLLHDTQSKARTQPGQLLGTPEYMPPEQCGGDGPIDERSDVYALGCVLFEMVCGHPPFVCRSLGEIVLAHRWSAPPPPSRLARVPAQLDQLITRMLSKAPEDRPSDMAEVSRALDELSEPPAAASIAASSSSETPPGQRPAHPLRGTRAFAFVAGTLVVAALGGATRLAQGRWRTGAGPRAPLIGSTSPVAATRGAAPMRAVASQAVSPEPPSVQDGSTSWPNAVTAQARPPAAGVRPAVSPGTASSHAAPSPSDRSAPGRRHGRSSRPQEFDVDGIVDL